MRYVAFKKPDAFWDGYDWVYALIEDKDSDYDFLLIDAATAAIARDRAADFFCKQSLREGGIEYIIEDAFLGLAYTSELEDEEILEFYGKKDGKTVLEFYEKYTVDAFLNDQITFGEGNKPVIFDKDDREAFYNFNQAVLEKLFKEAIRLDILVMPITKELK